MEVIKLEDDIIKKINQFAESINTGFYSSRNQGNNDKRITDQKCGKFGEYGVFFYLKSKNINVSEPDCKIYKVREKSWSPDLKIIDTDTNIHVKSQSIQSGKRYGVSWVFQKNDKHVFNTDSNNQYVSFVSVDLIKNECDIKSIVKLDILHNENLFKAPKLDYLKKNKCAIYYNDIKNKLFNI
jgi:hypothetical protein